MVSMLNELIDERLLFFLLVGEVLDRGSEVVEEGHVAEVEGKSALSFLLSLRGSMVLFLISQIQSITIFSLLLDGRRTRIFPCRQGGILLHHFILFHFSAKNA